MVTNVYEILLRFSSSKLLEIVQDISARFVADPEAFLLPYNSIRSPSACAALLGYTKEALREHMVEDGESILHFTKEVFKYQYLASAIGKRRFR